MQFPIGVFKYMVTANMHCHVFFPEPFVQTFQLLAEISEDKEKRDWGWQSKQICLFRKKTQ